MSVDPTAIEIQSDGETDPFKAIMEGYAYHGDTPFKVPFISRLTDDLFQGGCEWGLVLPIEIVHVVSLYPWEKYRTHDAVLSVREIPMFDSVDQGFGGVDEIAGWVNACRKDGPTLVHCQAGLNRSSLIAARALMLGDGLTADAAIALLREKRSPACLCNPAFENWLRGLDG